MKKLLALLALLLLAPFAPSQVAVPFDTGVHEPRRGDYHGGHVTPPINFPWQMAKIPAATQTVKLYYQSWTALTLVLRNQDAVPHTIEFHVATNNTQSWTAQHPSWTWCSPSVGMDLASTTLAPGAVVYWPVEYQGGNFTPLTIHPYNHDYLKTRERRCANTYIYDPVVYTVDGVWTATDPATNLVTPDAWQDLGIFVDVVWHHPDYPAPLTRWWGTLVCETP
ncbi:MAG: hypothetical protein M3N56_09670 [Actinomycetota bacterium]|nr:hypothetical protein [Actinomycetota bacterium]